MKILVVDDSKAMRMIVTRTLRQAGFADHVVLEAEDGRQALAVVAAEQPDVILSDWNMPELNGIDLLRELRAGGDTTRFGFVTSESTEAMRATAAEAGAMFLIGKPFTADTFAAELGPVLAQGVK